MQLYHSDDVFAAAVDFLQGTGAEKTGYRAMDAAGLPEYGYGNMQLSCSLRYGNPAGGGGIVPCGSRARPENTAEAGAYLYSERGLCHDLFDVDLVLISWERFKCGMLFWKA